MIQARGEASGNEKKRAAIVIAYVRLVLSSLLLSAHVVWFNGKIRKVVVKAEKALT